MKKIMALFLLACTLIGLAGCKKDPPKEEPKDLDEDVYEFSGPNTSYENRGPVQGAIHQYNYTPTDGFILKNGISDYKIVVPDNASADLIMYANEFSSLFNEATGAKLDQMSENEFEGNKAIFVGNTKAFKSTGITLDETQLKSQGYIIKTVGKSIYINGFSDAACLYGMYRFLKLSLNYEFFGPSTYYIDKNVEEIPLMNFDVIDAPDIEYREASYSFATGASARRYWLTINDAFMTVGGLKWHNTFAYLPPEVHKDEHPEWYSDDGTQLCYTAHGNEDSRQEMITRVANLIKDAMKANPNKTIVTFTIQDSNTFCDCKTCKASRQKYNGANSAVVIQFLNKVSDNIDEWFATSEGKKYDRDLKILFFAYLSTNTAPAKYDSETDSYIPIDESVICNDNVCAFFADIRGDYTHSFYDEDSANAIYIKNMKAWKACSKTLFFWTYSTNFRYYLTPYNSFNAMQETYKFAVECNVAYIYEQAQYNQGSAATGWSFLKQYLTSKLLWDVNLNQEELIEDFFNHFYSEHAAKIMKKLYDEYRVLANYQTDVLGFNGDSSIYHNALKPEYWEKNTLMKWLGYFDEALDRIEVLKKEDPGSYQLYRNHITAERVAYVYMLLKIYGSNLSDAELAYYKKMFHDDVEDNGMIFEGEGGALISDILR